MENQDPRLPKEINISEKSFAKEVDYITQKENDENLSPQIHLLSHSQYALWLNYQMMGEKRTVYNMGFATQILSPLDISALQKSCDRLVKRHPCLRSNIVKQDGKPVRIIHNDKKANFEITDASNWTLDKVKEQVIKTHNYLFELASDSLLRVSLFKRSEEDYVFLLTLDHIICDGWSLWLLLDELAQFYAAQISGLELDLPPLSFSYSDYVEWQSAMLSSSKGEKHWHYWQKQLQGDLPVLNLPTDKIRPPVQTYEGASVPLQISAELTQKLKELAKAEKSTLHMVLLAAFKILLYHYTGQEDIVVGSPARCRGRSEFAQLCGFLVNYVVMRADLSGNPTFKMFLQQVRRTVAEAIAHQDYPFALLVEKLEPNRDPSRFPLFQVSFVLQKPQTEENMGQLLFSGQPDTRVNWGGLSLGPLELFQNEGLLDIDLELLETKDSLIGYLKYNTDLFEVATIERMAGHWKNLLEGIVTNPDQSISQLPILSPAERHQLLIEWNKTAVEYPKDKCIHQLFEEQVEKTPDAVAVVYEEEQLTYQELNQKANQLGSYLQKKGVRPDELVGICVERSLEMMIGILGILKAGGAYVPIDPNYPSERIVYMLEDSQVGLLLTQEKLVTALPKTFVQLIFLDRDWNKIDKENKESCETVITVDNLAYVIYTSGSTGQPKGVLIQHSSLLNLVFWHKKTFSITASDRATQLAGISFDASVWEIYPYLISGAILQLAEPEVILSAIALKDWLTINKITIAFLPTSLAELLLSLDGLHSVKLRTLLTGGDKLHPIYSRDIPFQLVNNYGPTENTVVTTSGFVTQKIKDISPSIGKPIMNTQAYILDTNLQPVPIGVVGELYIGGDGLARGYLNRPELTAKKFIPNPFDPRQKSRLYQTGDLCRYLGDGNIEYMGRIDHQVKIRGFRIELGEIENVLNTHSDIRENVVVVKEDRNGNQCLVAYLVPFQNIGSTNKNKPNSLTQNVRQYLKGKIPSYMIPTMFVLLDCLPLTPNGKVDHRALPVPNWNWFSENEDFVLPNTPSQEIMVTIWQEVLKIDRISIKDNFFERGGHSLLATQVISRVREAFNIEIPIRALFEFPTVEELSQKIDRVDNHLHSNSEIIPISSISRESPLSLSFAQQRLWFLDQLEGKNSTYNIPATLILKGGLNQPALEQSINTIIGRHESLRTRFDNVNGEVIQIIELERPIGLEVINIEKLETNEQEKQVKLLALEEAQKPFNLTNDPLIRVSLIKLGVQNHILLITLHHIISDAWSMGIFFRELAEFYAAYSQGRDINLASLNIQYADYAVWQRQLLSGKAGQNQVNYWKEKLEGLPLLLEIPTDYPRPAVQTFQGAHQRFSLNVELSEKLKQLSQRVGVTLFMLLLSAFALLLSRYSRQKDIAIGSPIANRNRSEIEPIIGFFVNTLVMRLNLEDSPSISELLKQVRQTCLDAYAHQDIPFEKLVEELKPERNLSHTPLFQAMFALQNAPIEFKLPDLSVSLMEIESGIAKFDLSLSMEETEQGLIGNWEYNTDLFAQETISRMIGHFQVLLEEIVKDPTRPIDKLPILTNREKQKILVEWNNTAAEYPKDKCIHQLFEEQVEKTPDAVAVVYEEEKLTYQQLNQKANQLGSYLQKKGIKPDELVGICVERSLEMMIGILGILKVGGAYVPIDPNYPSERTVYMLEDSQVSLLLTQEKLVTRLPETQAEIISLDKETCLTELENTNNLNAEVRETNLAYVIYTSGSTGRPKGVMIQHQGLCNLAKAQIEYFKVDDSSRILQFASFSFDASISEIVMAICSGGRLCLASSEDLLPGKNLTQTLNGYGITHITLPPSALTVMSPETLSTVETIIVAGEACASSLAKKWSKDRKFFNGYGPTEDTVCATLGQYRQDLDKLVIGKPLPNHQVYILDTNLQPVPIGVVGEFYIGGDGLARGYLNRQELTAKKFIANPFDPSQKSRLYQTGDLCRYLGDGNIEYMGRIDHQVKIRGFRIELGEIENVLSSHTDVQEAIVIVQQETRIKQLVAFVVFNQTEGTEKKTEDLRSYLKEKLPNYMVPSGLMVLPRLPKTPNGKIDRQALPTFQNLRLTSESAQIKPQTTTEKLIAGIWQEILQLEKIGIHDNFFDLGGHSLLLAEMQHKLKSSLNQDISMVELFQYLTIHTLSKHLSQSKLASTQSNFPANSQKFDKSRSTQRGRKRQRQLRKQHRSNPED